MSALTIVDTDILIDVARHIDEAIDCLDRIERQSTLAVSVITQMEVFAGCRNKDELQSAERFLERFYVLKLNEQISDTTVDLLRKYRLSHGLTIPDTLIAATAIILDQRFISKNQRDYRFISGPHLLPYP